MKLTAMLPQNIYKADHPFIFIIQDKTTENILFLGKLVNPEE
jgi:serine protease inhibitor